MARVPYTEQADLPEEYRDLIVSELQGRTVHVYQAVGNNPPVLAGMRDFLGSLWGDTGLSGRRRELAILAVARALDSAYEWHQHVRIAPGEGVTEEEMIAIGEGDYGAFDDADAALLRYVAAVADGSVDDDLHDDLREGFPEDEVVVGATALAAGYAGLARIIDALDVEFEETFAGWDLANLDLDA